MSELVHCGACRRYLATADCVEHREYNACPLQVPCTFGALPPAWPDDGDDGDDDEPAPEPTKPLIGEPA